MGVNIGDACWAYSGFNRFRTKLAEAEGIDLQQLDGYAMEGHRFVKGLPWTDEDGNDITILRPFLDHSDCDGELTWQECEQVAGRIEQIIDTWPEPPDHRHERDINHGRLLVAAMRESVAARTELRFC